MSIDSPEEEATRRIRQLIWLYLWLLLIEGALRKWLVPRFSNELLLVRDPVMLAIYFYSIRARVFPRNFWVTSLWIIGGLSFLASALLSMFNLFSPLVPTIPVLEVALYGTRTNFFHLPLIFIIASVFDEEDVRKFGWWIIIAAVPMSLLMTAQFEASPDSFINRTAGLGEAEQLAAGGGKIRPPGTFSFISGPVFYMSMAAAFLIYGALRRQVYNHWLLIAGGGALGLGIIVSGSRSLVAAVVLVVLSVVAIFVVRPRAVNQFGRSLLIIIIGGLIVVRLPIFKEGAQILSDRFTESTQADDSTITGGLIYREFSDLTEGLKHMSRFPLFGYGLGIGTNVGGRILIGRAAFLLAESEWTRVLAESGPILGLAFLAWRTLLTFHLGRLSFRALKRDSILPILIFSSGFFGLLNGQLGQPTNLGFTALINGLCLAAMRSRLPDSTKKGPPSVDAPPKKTIPRRSVHADRLHGPEISSPLNNGSVDR